MENSNYFKFKHSPKRLSHWIRTTNELVLKVYFVLIKEFILLLLLSGLGSSAEAQVYPGAGPALPEDSRIVVLIQELIQSNKSSAREMENNKGFPPKLAAEVLFFSSEVLIASSKVGTGVGDLFLSLAGNRFPEGNAGINSKSPGGPPPEAKGSNLGGGAPSRVQESQPEAALVAPLSRPAGPNFDSNRSQFLEPGSPPVVGGLSPTTGKSTTGKSTNNKDDPKNNPTDSRGDALAKALAKLEASVSQLSGTGPDESLGLPNVNPDDPTLSQTEVAAGPKAKSQAADAPALGSTESIQTDAGGDGVVSNPDLSSDSSSSANLARRPSSGEDSSVNPIGSSGADPHPAGVSLALGSDNHSLAQSVVDPSKGGSVLGGAVGSTSTIVQSDGESPTETRIADTSSSQSALKSGLDPAIRDKYVTAEKFEEELAQQGAPQVDPGGAVIPGGPAGEPVEEVPVEEVPIH